MIRLLHTADLHLDAPFPGLGDVESQRRNDLLQTFERLLTLAIKSEVHLFLIAGDLFDSPKPSAATVEKVQSGLKRLVERGIVPVILPGTHDHVVSGDSVYRRCQFPGAVILDRSVVDEPVPIEIGGQAVLLYGFAYRSFASDDAFSGMQRRSDHGIHIGLLHGSRQGSPEWEYRKKDLPFSMMNLREWDLDYVALGHYHNFETLKSGGRVYACYPGSPEGKRFGENGPRYCALVSVEPGSAQVEKQVVNARMLEQASLDLSGCADLDEAVAAVNALGNDDLIMRLSLSGIVEAPIDLHALHSRCRGSFYHLEFDDRTRLFDSTFVRRIEDEETVRGVFVRRCRQRMQEVPAEKRGVIEEAFREVLVRFKACEGGEL